MKYIVKIQGFRNNDWPFSSIGDKELLTILIFLFSAHGVWEKNSLDEPATWSAPSSDKVYVQKAICGNILLPSWARELEGGAEVDLENCVDWKSLYSWSSCSFLKGGRWLQLHPWFHIGLLLPHDPLAWEILASSLVVYHANPNKFPLYG